jgi:dienelactone hydrolase
MASASKVGRALETLPRWLGPAERPLLGWLTVAGDPTTSGVLMLPPIGYEWWSSHRTLRTVAERLADAGHTVLRFDYDGSGDSAGSDRDPERVTAWRRSAVAAAADLRALGTKRLTVLGSRFGGLLALLDGAALDADVVVAWAPPRSGKRLARELRMLSQEVPGEEGSVAVSGVTFTAEALAGMSTLEIDPRAAPAPRVGLIGPGLERLGEQLTGLGVEVSVADPAGAASALEVPAEDAVVPEPVVDAIVGAVGPALAKPLPRPEERASATFECAGGEITERVVRVGAQGLAGVLTTPSGGPGRTVVVWLNSGSEPHVGSGRAWVEYGRALALRGHASLRLDFSGWGESPDRGHAPGRPYDAHGVDEAVETVAWLEEIGYERVVLSGLCAGAWIALRAVLKRPVAGVFALNPQLYWQPGDPVEALMSETRVRRTAEREREERGRRCGAWTLLDRLGHRPWAGCWLDQIAATEVPVVLCFAAGDDGLEYLENRLRRRLAAVKAAGKVQVVEIPDIDHSMHRAWLRERVVSTVGVFLDGLS